MKYILKKDLPLAKAGTEIELYKDSEGIYSNIWLPLDINYAREIATINPLDIPEWLEEVKEPKTIYDLKEGDVYWYISDNWIIDNHIYHWHEFTDNWYTCCFLTEREAKRNKLLRQLATRTDKFIPEEGGEWIDLNWNRFHWYCDQFRHFDVNLWIVFRNKEEYNKYINEEARDLLFNL